jgi:hypothetical protein
MAKIRIEIVDDLLENEIIIRCSRVDETIQKMHHYLLEQSLLKSKITFYKIDLLLSRVFT